MLLPSAFACGDSSQTLSQPSRNHNLLFASPPLSPTLSLSPTPTISNLFQSCRALQSMLTTPTQLPSPPTLHAEIPSSPPTRTSHPRLRLRIPSPAKRVVPETGDRKRISKRTPREVSRGINKRRRDADDDMIHERMDDVSEQERGDSTLLAPRTPKRRRRIAPEILPLGLERSDFHTLRLAEMENTATDDGAFVFSAGGDSQSRNREAQRNEEEEEDGENWSREEDRMLVELVLKKLKLSKSDWQDCARSLGKDRGNLGRRWKTLIGAGEVGLKGRRKTRTKLNSTWS
ncbi:uncharacterized protein EAE97_003176 [Botrytis byssoidea]|uniref:Myb-like domain-containing protein n=1 Tax=Botrytis byssoidea TaxID=139641 RepID=A0A9P5LX54_9HELO|nr:uncharacterized protein EAE97_003176 [Botrytis byssoidea]KAF7949667.1 hypothetical protein EAE97_003176 [Botrytis byssoidea]